MIPMQNVKFVSVTPPVAIVDDASWTTTEIDTLGWDYCTICVYLGATDIAVAALTLTESETAGSGHANVTAGIWGTANNHAGSSSTLPSATDDNKMFLYEIDLRDRMRYLDLTFTAGDGSAGTFAVAIAVLSRGNMGPTTVAERGDIVEILRF